MEFQRDQTLKRLEAEGAKDISKQPGANQL